MRNEERGLRRVLSPDNTVSIYYSGLCPGMINEEKQ